MSTMLTISVSGLPPRLSIADAKQHELQMYRELGRADEAAIQAAIRWGKFTHQIRLQLPPKLFADFVANDGRGVHGQTRKRCEQLYLDFATKSGELDMSEVRRRIDEFNATAAERGLKPINKISLRGLQILSNTRTPDKIRESHASHARGHQIAGNPSNTDPRYEIDDIMGFAPAKAQSTPTTSDRPGALPGLIAGGNGSRLAAGDLVRVTHHHRAEVGQEELGHAAPARPAVSPVKIVDAAGASERRMGIAGTPARLEGGTSGNGAAGNQLTLEREYRAAAMARELASLIESGRVNASVLAEFVAFAERVGLGLVGGD